ncbi:hypothetical protein SBRCBS47491_008079 [Sporothrix bragantina]|uniref:Uncharacterized protein n=1 Tax=Sporothrix bragantina TaxID=671064 RepID=A0ABP0CIE8_9PEZI
MSTQAWQNPKTAKAPTKPQTSDFLPSRLLRKPANFNWHNLDTEDDQQFFKGRSGIRLLSSDKARRLIVEPQMLDKQDAISGEITVLEKCCGEMKGIYAVVATKKAVHIKFFKTYLSGHISNNAAQRIADKAQNQIAYIADDFSNYDMVMAALAPLKLENVSICTYPQNSSAPPNVRGTVILQEPILERNMPELYVEGELVSWV